MVPRWCKREARYTVPKAGCPSISLRAGTRAVSMARHPETAQARTASVWEPCNTLLPSLKNKANRPVVFVKCQHLKRTTKTDFSEIHNVLEVAVRCPRKKALRWKGETRGFSPLSLYFAGCVGKCQLFEGKTWRVQLCILSDCLMFQNFVRS